MFFNHLLLKLSLTSLSKPFRFSRQVYLLHPQSLLFNIYTTDIMIFDLSIFYGLCFWLAIASATVNLAQVVSSNENLQEQSTNADTDVNNVNVINALEAAPKVTQDLEGINSALKIVFADAEQVEATSDGGDESSVTSSFSSFSDALTKLMNDLISQESALALFGQKDMIHGNLTLLQDSYDAYSSALQSITTTESYIESIDESTGGALGQIGSAVSAYA